jgi:hypothetical protein
MAAKHKQEIISLTELLVHVPPRGRRVALVTLATESGPSVTKYDLTESLIGQIVSLLRNEGTVIE